MIGAGTSSQKINSARPFDAFNMMKWQGCKLKVALRLCICLWILTYRILDKETLPNIVKLEAKNSFWIVAVSDVKHHGLYSAVVTSLQMIETVWLAT